MSGLASVEKNTVDTDVTIATNRVPLNACQNFMAPNARGMSLISPLPKISACTPYCVLELLCDAIESATYSGNTKIRIVTTRIAYVPTPRGGLRWLLPTSYDGVVSLRNGPHPCRTSAQVPECPDRACCLRW